MSADLDYELMKYDAYSSYVQIFLRRGVRASSSSFSFRVSFVWLA